MMESIRVSLGYADGTSSMATLQAAGDEVRPGQLFGLFDGAATGLELRPLADGGLLGADNFPVVTDDVRVGVSEVLDPKLLGIGVRDVTGHGVRMLQLLR